MGPGKDEWGFGQIVAFLPALFDMPALVGDRVCLFLDAWKTLKQESASGV